MSIFMSILLSPSFIFLIIIFSSIAVSTVLKSKVEKHTAHLISRIMTLPAIPVYWLWTSSTGLNSPFFSFYFPLFITILAISMFLIAIIKYRKKQFSGKETTAK